jgi:hypothetical protein
VLQESERGRILEVPDCSLLRPSEKLLRVEEHCFGVDVRVEILDAAVRFGIGLSWNLRLAVILKRELDRYLEIRICFLNKEAAYLLPCAQGAVDREEQ